MVKILKSDGFFFFFNRELLGASLSSKTTYRRHSENITHTRVKTQGHGRFTGESQDQGAQAPRAVAKIDLPSR